LLHDGKPQHKLDGFQKRRMSADPGLRDVAGVGRWGDLGIRHWMVLVVPDEYCGIPGLIGCAVQYRLNVRACPGINCAVIAVVAIITKGRSDKRISRHVGHVEFGIGPDFGRAEVMIVVRLTGAIGVGPVVVKIGNMLRGIAGGRTAGRGTLHVIPGGAARQPYLSEDVIVG